MVQIGQTHTVFPLIEVPERQFFKRATNKEGGKLKLKEIQYAYYIYI